MPAKCRRWLTDVTPLKSLLKPGKCTFTTQTAPWALPWKPSLRLIFSEPVSEGECLRLLLDSQVALDCPLTFATLRTWAALISQ